ncbi:VCBS repeat-containing protein [Planctomycetota bacterium]|nr:VCBS repeat-containing protein [Planctomycetota bacterium]
MGIRSTDILDGMTKVIRILTSLVFGAALAPSVPAQTFGPQVTISTAAPCASSVAADDIDGDGVIDVVSYSRTTNTNFDAKVAWYQNQGAGEFALPVVLSASFQSGGQLRSVDIDGDADADLVVSSPYDGLFWFENLGGGTFAASQYLGGLTANGLVLEDIDGDGLADISASGLTTSPTSPYQLFWIRNLGGGSFGAPQVIYDYASGQGSYFDVGDIDGDGDIDFALCYKTGGTFLNGQVTWLESLGGGQFAPERVVDCCVSASGRIRCKDLDSDGLCDVAVYRQDTGSPFNTPQVEIFWNESAGLNWSSSTADGPWNVGFKAADFDLDNEVDLAGVSGGNPGSIGWSRNLRGRQFSSQEVISPLASGNDLDVADLDGDGDLDLLSASCSSARIAWYENLTVSDCNGNGVIDELDITVGTSSDCNGNGVPDECELLEGVAGDCNGNGVLDSCELLSGAALDCNGNGVLDCCEVTTFAGVSQLVNAAPLGAPWSLEDADLDLDGDLDLVVGARGQGSIFWYANDGTGRFGEQRTVTTAAEGVFSIVAFDADGDGDDEIVAAESVSDSVVLYLNDGANFGVQIVLDASLDGPRSVAAGDVDGDGDLDVIAGSLNDDTVAWYPNMSGTGFGARQTITTNADFVLCVGTLDVDGDGDLDVISASRDDDAVRIFENLGSGAAWSTHLVASIDQPSCVRSADLNGDGREDLAVTSVSDGALYWVENLGPAVAFGAPTLLSSSIDRASSLAISDFDLDGDFDLVTSSYGESQSSCGEIAWFENLGGGVLREKSVVAGGLQQAAFVLAADFNGNGWPDIASTVWLGGEVDVYRNQLDSLSAVDCDANGVPDDCDIAAGAADCDADGVLDICQIAADPTLDLDANGTLDACEAIGTTYCSPAVANSTGFPGVVTILGNETVFLNDFKVSARQLPTSAFGYFIASTTPGSVFPVSNSVGTLCVIGSVGRGVGGGIVNSGSDGFFYGSVNLNAMPQPVGTVMVQPGDTWHFQAWHRDASGGQTTSNFTDAVAVTFQ